jgi:hypothetical protein
MGASTEQTTTAVLMALDAAAVDVLGALERAGARPVLLKGPSIARWLYDQPGERVYVDIDVLVAPDAAPTASNTLQTIGFSYVVESWNSSVWVRRRSGVNVDLHTALLGIGLAPAPAFDALTRSIASFELDRGAVPVLETRARALHIVLHAAQHGAWERTSLEDLRRALERLPDEIWADAAALAAEVDATTAFAAGLRLLPKGANLAERLGLSTALTTLVAMRAATAPVVSEGLMSLAATPGLVAKMRLIAREVAPTSAYLRTHFPFARRGRLGLALARVWRPIWLLLHLGPALLAIRRARRASRGSG